MISKANARVAEPTVTDADVAVLVAGLQPTRVCTGPPCR
jgi:hypothetical protein